MTDCESPQLMPVEEAVTKMLASINPKTSTQIIHIDDALNRILSDDLFSPINVPPHNNSAMDGYALALVKGQKVYQCVGVVFAGQPFQGELKPGECVRIMTGGVIPFGANSVVMQENTKADNQLIHLLVEPELNENIRVLGDDICQNQLVFNQGHKLSAIDIGLLASLGIQTIRVQTKLVVGLLTTGDELCQPGTQLAAGQIYDSNRPMLKAMLSQLNINIIDKGVVPDSIESITNAFNSLAKVCDAIISSGGVSVGDADYTKQVLANVGSINFWKLAIKPGKPFAFGQIGQTLFFGLPGNPVSAAVTFDQLVAPALAHLAGHNNKVAVTLKLPLFGQLKKRPGRKDYQRGKLILKDGAIVGVESAGKQSSGVLSSVVLADCYIVLAAQQGNVNAGELVNVELFKPYFR